MATDCHDSILHCVEEVEDTFLQHDVFIKINNSHSIIIATNNMRKEHGSAYPLLINTEEDISIILSSAFQKITMNPSVISELILVVTFSTLKDIER